MCKSSSKPSHLRVVGARQHNLKNITVSFPRHALSVVTGLSGSGKSSLAFDTIYAEGERKYVESLSTYARQFLQQMPKPEVDRIDNLSPTIAIEQRGGVASPRSTVATTTEIYDFLRVLFAQVGSPHCHICAQPITQESVSQMVDIVLDQPEGAKLLIIAPLPDEPPDTLLARLARQGFVRIRINGEVLPIEEAESSIDQHNAPRIEAVVDRLVVKSHIGSRLADSLEIALKLGRGRVIATIATDGTTYVDHPFSLHYACPAHPDVSLPELSPRVFSFNSPHGACPDCNGLGTVLEFDPELIVPDRDLSLEGGAITPWQQSAKRSENQYTKFIDAFCKQHGISPRAPFRNIPEDVTHLLLHGHSEDCQSGDTNIHAVIPELHRRWKNTESETVKQRLHQYQSEAPCHSCNGGRLCKNVLAVTIGGSNISDLCNMSIANARTFFETLSFAGEQAVIAEQPVREIRNRLTFLDDVGVGYLSLSRNSATLSGGETQRIQLATQIGSGLVGMCYVLDEPTIGLHQRDSRKLVTTLRKMADAENTLIVVEHDEDVIAAADYVVDVGPGAGVAGGEVVFEGSLKGLLACDESTTGQYLSGHLTIPVPTERRRVRNTGMIEIRDATEHNLKNITARFPTGCFVCVTGVSGSGKSTLVTNILHRTLHRRLFGTGPKPGAHRQIVGANRVDKVIQIDQSPIGRSPRSNPATYVGVFDLIRKLYASTREAKLRGYGPGRFSFNVKGGRCEQCQGQGTKRIEMHFLPDVFVECTTCHGSRYNRETLEVRYRGKSIADVLELRVDESVLFFKNFPKIKQQIRALIDVGLGYVRLGQSSTTLSGGEAQRVKLASELGKSATGHTLYMLDEPTTGLHFADIHRLLNVLNTLVALGNTVVVIEHNLDVIKVADWVIDMGPEGGEAGGQIVAEGRPEDIVKNRRSYTGKYLKGRLAGLPPLDIREAKTTRSTTAKTTSPRKGKAKPSHRRSAKKT